MGAARLAERARIVRRIPGIGHDCSNGQGKPDGRPVYPDVRRTVLLWDTPVEKAGYGYRAEAGKNAAAVRRAIAGAHSDTAAHTGTNGEADAGALHSGTCRRTRAGPFASPIRQRSHRRQQRRWRKFSDMGQSGSTADDSDLGAEYKYHEDPLSFLFICSKNCSAQLCYIQCLP